MSKREREFKQSLNQEKARVKLYKAGKNWVKSGIKEIKLLGILGMPVFKGSEKSEIEVEHVTGDMIQRNVLKTTAIIGGAFTVNMLHDQQALADSELPITSELSSYSETVGNQNSTVVNQSESSELQSTSEKANSESEKSTSEKANSESETSTSEKANSESETSTSEKANSESETSTSEKANSESETSTSEKANSESETSTSEKANSESETSISEKANSESETSTSEKADSESEKSTSEKVDSESGASTSEKSYSEAASTTEHISRKSEKSIEERTYSSSEINNNLSTTESISEVDLESSSIRLSTSSDTTSEAPIRVRRAVPNLMRAAATTSQSATYTGAGIDRVYNVPIYYKLVVTSDGKNEMFTYTVTYDNPNTTTVEKLPRNASSSYSIKNSTTSTSPMFTLGSGYGRPTTAYNYIADYSGKQISAVPSGNLTVSKVGSGYSWSNDYAMNGHYAKQGAGLVTTWTVPITGSGNDYSWTFTPFTSRTSSSINYFNGTISGTDPVKSTSVSTSASSSMSLSNSASASTSSSTSLSNSASASTSSSTSLSN
ncbi:MAG: KxYKxGKxW signal peptide domain-containing protein, partial [Staphylococcus sp.]|uniref:KxYKxGKxW signal peptide domain-containing protein n=1 Tax=Staphylococcus sp. TaxID=29387 RepID=UPI003F99A180